MQFLNPNYFNFYRELMDPLCYDDTFSGSEMEFLKETEMKPLEVLLLLLGVHRTCKGAPWCLDYTELVKF